MADLSQRFTNPDPPCKAGLLAAQPRAVELKRQGVPDTMSSLVQRAAGDDPSARNEIALLYRGPLIRWLADHGCGPEQAEDVAQEYLAALLAEGTGFLRGYDRKRAKLRTFLRVTLRNFLNTLRKSAAASKRGGGAQHLSLDLIDELTADLSEKSAAPCGSKLDAVWALAIYDRVLRQVEKDWLEHKHKPRKEAIFQALKPYLLSRSPAYTDLDTLGIQGNAGWKVDFSQLRQRFREAWATEVKSIVPDPVDVAIESRELMSLLLQNVCR